MNLLIVDDSDLMQSRLASALIKMDSTMNISQAHSCKEAMEIFTPLHPDKVILDISLPDGSGINLLKMFKKDDPEVVVIVFTNYPIEEFRESCLDLGASQFIDKNQFHLLIKLFS